jgi:hypothetical protein
MLIVKRKKLSFLGVDLMMIMFNRET